MGKPAEARALFAQIEPVGSQIEAATFHVLLGERDQALRSLEKAVQQRDNHLIWLNGFPQFDSLRSDPRFLAVASQVNLPAGPK